MYDVIEKSEPKRTNYHGIERTYDVVTTAWTTYSKGFILQFFVIWLIDSNKTMKKKQQQIVTF